MFIKTFILIVSLVTGLSSAQAVEETVDGTSRNVDTDSKTKPSFGGFFVEPMLIYSKNETSIKTSQLPVINNDTSGTLNDAAIGARFGLHVGEIFILAADGRYGKSRFQDSFYSSAEASSYNYGLTAGIQTPVAGIQLFGTYIVGGAFDPAVGAQNIDMKFTDALGYRVGAGIHVLAVSVNLEYQDLVYNNSTVESFGDLAVNRASTVDASQSGYSISLGFPVEF